MKSRRVTIRDVARHAGVSVCTVSRVFNNKGVFPERTRQRVLLAANELHFTPNGLIRSLQRGETRTVGVAAWSIGADPLHEIALPALRGIVEGLATTGRDLLLYTDLQRTRDENSASVFLDKRVDGAIWGPAGAPVSALERLAASGLPAVILYYDPVPAGLGCVNVDNAGGAEAAVDYLVNLGHRRIAFDGHQRHPSFRARAEGYVQALERHGIPLDPALLLMPQEGWLPVQDAANRLLALPDPPTALFAGSDHRAFGWLEELARRGVRVPEDLSVVGFDDVPAASMGAGLTTLRQPYEQVGRTAAVFVDRLISGRPPAECRIVLPVELVVRGTTGPPAE